MEKNNKSSGGKSIPDQGLEAVEKKEAQPVRLDWARKTLIGILIAAILIVAAFFIYSIGKRAGVKNVRKESSEKTVANNENITTSQTAPDITVAANDSNIVSDSTVPQEEAAAGVSKADLYVVSYYFSEDPEKGEGFKVFIKIGNKGNAYADDFHWEWWSSSSKKSCEGETDGLAAGKTRTVECEYTYESWSTYATRAVVDSKYEIDESNEGNNIAAKQVIPIHDEKPDLYVSSYSFNHDPVQGEEFKVSITIKNKGEGDADSFHWEWWPTAYGSACRDEIGDLDPGESKTVTCTYTYGGWANYATKAVADADNEVSESNEGNNTYSKNIVPIH